jgi:hypothetical protein
MLFEADNSGIGHRSCEVGRKTLFKKTKIKCALRLIYAFINVDDPL